MVITCKITFAIVKYLILIYKNVPLDAVHAIIIWLQAV